MSMLTAEEKAVLRFEASWWLHPGAKDQSIEQVLGLTAARYYDILAGLVSRPEAERFDPLTVRRVRALIEPVGEAVGS